MIVVKILVCFFVYVTLNDFNEKTIPSLKNVNQLILSDLQVNYILKSHTKINSLYV